MNVGLYGSEIQHVSVSRLYILHRPVASHPGVCVCGGGGLNLDGWNTGAHTGFPEGGGGVKTFTSAPPLGHCPRDVIRPLKN